MNLDWYYTFIILAKTLNYRLASEEINLTIPSIHKQIKNLEQHLNVKLFETYKNQIILTENGQTFLPIAQSFIEQYESGIKHIQLQKTMFKSKLNVVVSSYIATFIMPKFLNLYFNDHPNVDISIHIKNENIEKDINKHLYDIGICRNQPKLREVKSEKVCEGKIVMVVPNEEQNHALSEKALFSKYKIISNNHPEYWPSLKNNILNIYEKAQFLSINDVHTSIKLIEMNQGISFLPIYITTNSDYHISVINTNVLQAPISFTYIYSKKDSPEIAAFIKLFKRFIADEQSL
ncbi:TPA: LysR family transcriptional regulator [Staphylococcus argenteus]|uniref:LysR family transcriptional regulator n=1 Tax=Staphylococcus argenteus TaxID=985002 RepID=UPI000233FEC6|nr:LysR family transcriptional regulator [Staphylococcus argenteus]MBE2130299.1 LysR family transcriptional regulator [Staphylococcus argenteus]PNY93095.1 LysR family transcriptional regulator [Staphylococcus argenteus]CCE58681.1 LysR-family regulatory protein [Staphylococcus argenteus]SUJ07511.1 LysR-family regulatory protein [Staphylococcus argenteus]HDY9428304.1 LysR family transcriptional regulator [Staphylococcus argenteus]